MADVQTYLDLITSEHRQKPNYNTVLTFNASITVQIQNILLMMIDLFDIDIAQGVMLDVIGQWVGVSRTVAIPITGIYFSWDQTADVGWEFGSWAPPNQNFDITSLPDDAYRTLIRAKIAANNWDGTIEGAYSIWSVIFVNTVILIQDHQNMSYDMILFGTAIDSLTLALLTGGYIKLKPEGVRINSIFTPVDSNKLFGWDLENTYFAGWDEGSWAKESKFGQ